MTAGLLALAGVAVGALLNWLLARWNRREEQRERRRTELLDVTSAFLSDVDAVWRAAQRLEMAVLNILAIERNKETPPEVHQRWEAERQAAFEDRREPARRVELAIMHLRIIAPALVELASVLRHASGEYESAKHKHYVERRTAAADAFVEAVKVLLAK